MSGEKIDAVRRRLLEAAGVEASASLAQGAVAHDEPHGPDGGARAAVEQEVGGDSSKADAAGESGPGAGGDEAGADFGSALFAGGVGAVSAAVHRVDQ